jgi:hypothetical protein
MNLVGSTGPHTLKGADMPLAPSSLAKRLALSVIGLSAVLAAASACAGPPDPCNICDSSKEYCLIHLGEPHWTEQISCKSLPASCSACDCVLATDFLMQAQPKCVETDGRVDVTPPNDC